jgi:D-aspartate ligase
VASQLSRCVVRSLGKLGVPVYAIIEDRFVPAAASRYLTGTFLWGATDLGRPQVLDGLAKIGGRLDRPTILIPADDCAAVLIAEEAATLGECFIFPDVPANLPRTVTNKQLLHGLSKQLGCRVLDRYFPLPLLTYMSYSKQ